MLAFDGADHALVEDAEILMEGDRIVALGPRSERPADRIEHFGQALIAPGFIDCNALADVDTTILGFGETSGRSAKSVSRRYAEASARDVLTPAQQLASARFALSRLLLSGITTALPVTSLLFRRWAESAEEFASIAALSDELGIRLVLGPSYRSAVNVVEDDGRLGQVTREDEGRAGLADAVRFIEGCADLGPLVSGLLVPSTIETCSDALMLETAQAARDLGVPFRLHCCQSQAEAEMIWRRTGRTSIRHLQDLGLLDEHALLPHAVDLGGPGRDPARAAADIAALEGTGATVVHCPLVIGRGGRRLESFAGLRERGIRIAIGTDTAPADMLMNLQMGLAMARTIDGPAATPADLYRAATLDGAAAIGRSDLGRLAQGAKADVVVWDLSSLSVQPVFDPVAALFLMPPDGRARDVFVGGRRCVENGRLTLSSAMPDTSEIQTIAAALLDSFAERHPDGTPWQTLFPPAFTQGSTGRTGSVTASLKGDQR
jgi:cytosine/adenosine deaminase-related metal-dependent hydrolase